MFDLTTYVKKWRIRQLKTVFSTLDTLCGRSQTIFKLSGKFANIRKHLDSFLIAQNIGNCLEISEQC